MMTSTEQLSEFNGIGLELVNGIKRPLSGMTCHLALKLNETNPLERMDTLGGLSGIVNDKNIIQPNRIKFLENARANAEEVATSAELMIAIFSQAYENAGVGNWLRQEALDEIRSCDRIDHIYDLSTYPRKH
jgi:hypothetical protein